MSVNNNNRKITQLPSVSQSAMTDSDIFVFVHSGVTSQGTLGDISSYATDGLTGIYSTGGTFNQSGSTITINDNQGGGFDITGITSENTYITSGTYSLSADTLTLNNSNDSDVAITGLTPINTQFIYVDAVNGTPNGIIGSRTRAFDTIAGAEAVFTTGQTIVIISDVKECGMGIDQGKYLIENGCKIWFPSSDPTPTGLTSGHLWSDSKAGTAIYFEIYGGYHEGEGNWYGNFDRGIIRNNYGSTIKMIGAEKIFAKGNSQDLMVISGTGGSIEMHCDGDIISGLNGIQFTNAIDSKVVITAQGKIQQELRMIGQYGSSQGNTAIIQSASEIISLGHDISGLRSFTYTNAGNPLNKDHYIIKAPKITWYDEYPNLSSNNGGFIFGWSNSYVKVDVVADILTMSHTDPDTYPDDSGLLGLNRTSSQANYDITLDINTIILGKGHQFDDTYSSINRANALVKLKGATTLVFMTDIVEPINGLQCDDYSLSVEGVLKIVQNPDAILSGATALGFSSGNDAHVMGYIITNGNYYDANFTELFTGNVGGAITNIKVNDSSVLTDFENYRYLL